MRQILLKTILKLFSTKPEKVSLLKKVEPPKVVGFIDITEMEAREAYNLAYKKRKKKK